MPGRFKVIVTLESPIIVVDEWREKPSKEQILEMLANEMRERKYDGHFHIVVMEA